MQDAIAPDVKISVRERLAQKLIRTPQGCLEWAGTKTPLGYGKISVAGKRWYVHRLVMELENEALPDGMVVDHKCRNRACVELSHLQLVTQKQNLENQSEIRRTTSGHRGVSWCAQSHTWKVRVNHFGRSVWGGRYPNLDDAVAAAVRLRYTLYTNSLGD